MQYLSKSTISAIPTFSNPVILPRFSKCIRTAILLIIYFCLSACSVIGIRTAPEPAFTVEQSGPDVEIRRYEPMVVASTSVKGDFEAAGETAFQPLFEYISGANDAKQEIPMTAPVVALADEPSQRIPMTAPVIASRKDNQWQYQFVLPADMSVATAPEPTNPAVKIDARPARKMAVWQFSGLLTEAKKNKNIAHLENWLKEQDRTSIGEPLIASYDPPWTIPWFRRNEVMIEIN